MLNDAKTEILVVGPKALRHHFHPILTSLLVKPCEDVKNLGVTLDADQNFQKHISNITKSAFYHLRHISKVCGLLSLQDSEKLVHSFISSRLDYCNALYAGLTKQMLHKLQLIQNAAARILTRTSKFNHITSILKSLQWLPVKQRIELKTRDVPIRSRDRKSESITWFQTRSESDVTSRSGIGYISIYVYLFSLKKIRTIIFQNKKQKKPSFDKNNVTLLHAVKRSRTRQQLEAGGANMSAVWRYFKVDHKNVAIANCEICKIGIFMITWLFKLPHRSALFINVKR